MIQCPLINANDSRCSVHMNMQNLADAYELCTHRFLLCPIYHELMGAELALSYTGGDLVEDEDL